MLPIYSTISPFEFLGPKHHWSRSYSTFLYIIRTQRPEFKCLIDGSFAGGQTGKSISNIQVISLLDWIADTWDDFARKHGRTGIIGVLLERWWVVWSILDSNDSLSAIFEANLMSMQVYCFLSGAVDTILPEMYRNLMFSLWC